MKKRIGILCMVICMLLSGCGAKEKTENTDSYQLRVGNMAKSIKPAMVVVASLMNFYSEEGLNVKFEDISTLNDALSAIQSENLDVLPLGIIPTVSSIAQGAELRIIGGTISEGGQAIIKEENRDSIKSIDDFKGRKIAVVQAETAHMYAEYYMVEKGIDLEEDVEIVVLDSFQSVIQAVLKGEVEVGWVNSGFGQVAENQGLKVALNIGDVYPDSVCCRQTTSKKVIDENREALVRFEKALVRAYQYYLTNKDDVIKRLMEFSGQPKEYVEYCLYAEVMKIQLDPCKNNVKEFYKVMERTGRVESGKDDVIENAIDPTIYKEALDRLIEEYPEEELYKQLEEAYHEKDE